MKFPNQKYPSIAAYYADYRSALTQALASVDAGALQRAADLLTAAHERHSAIWACGNGGSAAICNHLMCDHGKGVHADTGVRPRVISLSSSPEVITAIGNDMAFAEVFAHQLRLVARPDDVLIVISSSGDSENVVQAATWARANQVSVIAMTGFSGGRLAGLADVHLHVAAENYGVAEDVHQSLMHTLAQFLRQARMGADLVQARKF